MLASLTINEHEALSNFHTTYIKRACAPHTVNAAYFLIKRTDLRNFKILACSNPKGCDCGLFGVLTMDRATSDIDGSQTDYNKEVCCCLRKMPHLHKV